MDVRYFNDTESAPPASSQEEVANKLFLPFPVLSLELREFLTAVAQMYPDPNEAIAWLQANNNALQGQSPVNMIRMGQVAALNDFWHAHALAHGDASQNI